MDKLIAEYGSLADLANESKIARGTLRDIHIMRQEPSLKTVRKLALFLDVDPGDLVTTVESESDK